MTATTKVKATELGIAGLSRHGVLADGALIVRNSIQRDRVYVKVVTPDGHARTRRYRHDQMVSVRDDTATEPKFYAARDDKSSAKYGEDLWGVREQGKPGWCAITFGRKITHMGSRADAARDAAWLNAQRESTESNERN
jgi:hypothetical protein